VLIFISNGSSHCGLFPTTTLWHLDAGEQGPFTPSIQKGKNIVILLCGGDKSTQAKDIKAAFKLAKEVK
jgi:hypothetical protein